MTLTKKKKFREFEKQYKVAIQIEGKSQISIKGVSQDIRLAKTGIQKLIAKIITFEHHYSIPNPECHKILQNKLNIRLDELRTPTLLTFLWERDHKYLFFIYFI